MKKDSKGAVPALALNNAEVRKRLFGDSGIIGRDLLARRKDGCRDIIAHPDEEHLRWADEPGSDHGFISRGREVGPDQMPIPEARVPSSGIVLRGTLEKNLGKMLLSRGRRPPRQPPVSDDNLQSARRELRTLLERSANGVSTVIIVNAIRQLYDESRHDDGPGHWLREVNEFVRQAHLTKDLSFNGERSFKYKSELWTDSTDEAFNLVLEYLTLSGCDAFLNVVSVDVHNRLKFSPHDTIYDESRHENTLVLGQIQADLRDVTFLRRACPRLHLATAQHPACVFQVVNVVVKVDLFKFAVQDDRTAHHTTGLVKR
ncbi:uncharacterized protein FIBRA_05454 [Fibroporia radiculosa]|uniref:HAM1-like N-terminal domain-containing protein n=1 Tax=Fibroporia radiculosa TaxID=599839 RepID=J4IAQ6_9APHY|nr:uncharacterized protein FIBRA_05454 [Fibroporia radiculosa]CCM03326.1 predicted protein [Fibroporia radiculosa]